MDPRIFVTSLISSIQADPTPPDTTRAANPLLHASDEIQKALLTLHVLFPNELLPALDLLDRGLVTRLHVMPNVDHDDQFPPCNGQDPEPQPSTLEASDPNPRAPPRAPLAVYLVRSGQLPSRGRPTTATSSSSSSSFSSTTSYEIRLEAWSCSCPAFAFAAFPASTPSASGSFAEAAASTHSDFQLPIDQMPQQQLGWHIGGRTLGTDMPVCKHLLACVLVEHTAVFSDMAEEREVSLEELAGWAAGWGD